MEKDMTYEELCRNLIRRAVPREGFVLPRDLSHVHDARVRKEEEDPYRRMLEEFRRAVASGILQSGGS